MSSKCKSETAPFFSILMAAYNAEKYIHESVDSVLAQLFEEWELICIDDGSTDNTLEILKEYQKRDSRIIVKSQANAGINAARATAAKFGNGRYFGMLDSDDKFSSDYLNEVYKVASSTDNDAILPDIYFRDYQNDENSWKWNERFKTDVNSSITGREAFLRTFPWTVHGWGFWRRDIFQGVPFNKLNTYNADELRARELFLACDKVIFSGGLYHYRQHNDSISKKFNYRLFERLITYKTLEEIGYANGFAHEQLAGLRHIYFHDIIEKQKLYYEHYHSMDAAQRKKALQLIRSAYTNFYDIKSTIAQNGWRGFVKNKLLCSGYSLFALSIRAKLSLKKILCLLRIRQQR